MNFGSDFFPAPIISSYFSDCMVRGWIAKSADWPRINRNYTPALDIQQCHYMCHSVPGCRSFSFEDETKSCLTFSGIASAPQAIRSPTLKSAIGVKSGKLEKWCSMNRPLILKYLMAR